MIKQSDGTFRVSSFGHLNLFRISSFEIRVFDETPSIIHSCLLVPRHMFAIDEPAVVGHLSFLRFPR